MTHTSDSQALNVQALPADRLAIWPPPLDWLPSPQQQAQLQSLYTEVVTANQRLNLTRITDPDDFWEKHLWDSLIGIARFVPNPPPGYRLIDVGTGGGFPGLPLAIACPDWQITLLDATQKKVKFLQSLPSTLGLPHVRALVGRAEALGRESGHRAYYDLASIRAVGPASVCAEYTLPFLKVGGQAILYRGQWTEAETQQLTQALEPLGGVLETIEAHTTPISNSIRHLIYLRKQRQTPKTFPRPIGVPAQNPL